MIFFLKKDLLFIHKKIYYVFLFKKITNPDIKYLLIVKSYLLFFSISFWLIELSIVNIYYLIKDWLWHIK